MEKTPLRTLSALTLAAGLLAALVTPATAGSKAVKKGLGDNEPAWFESWGKNKTGVPTPAFNCAVHDPSMRKWLGRRRKEFSEDFKPFGCSIWADSDSAPTMYKGHHEGYGNSYW